MIWRCQRPRCHVMHTLRICPPSSRPDGQGWHHIPARAHHDPSLHCFHQATTWSAPRGSRSERRPRPIKRPQFIAVQGKRRSQPRHFHAKALPGGTGGAPGPTISAYAFCVGRPWWPSTSGIGASARRSRCMNIVRRSSDKSAECAAATSLSWPAGSRPAPSAARLGRTWSPDRVELQSWIELAWWRVRVKSEPGSDFVHGRPRATEVGARGMGRAW